MQFVYLMWHLHPTPSDDENAKFIGAYRTENDAKRAIERLRHQPGFRHFPENFHIEKYEINKDHWTEGFVTAVHKPDGTISYENE
jgi:hypothetical protein